jgi:hypothetical protein
MQQQAAHETESCYRHRGAEAVGTCKRCHEPKCHRCLRGDGRCVECYLQEPITFPLTSRRVYPFSELGTELVGKRGFLGFVWDTGVLYLLCFLTGIAYLKIFAWFRGL